MFDFRIMPPLLVVALTGCAGLPADRGLSEVSALVESRGGPALGTPGEVPATGLDAEVAALLHTPLRVNDAIRVALARNPRLQAGFAQLGIAQADHYDAVRLTNPSFSVGVFDSNESGAARQISLGLAQNFTELLLLSARRHLAESELERARMHAGRDVQELISAVRRAYYEYVGARQIAQVSGLIAKATELSARLAGRFFAAGNINQLELQLQKAAATQSEITATAARAQAGEARAALSVLMGLHAEDDWTVVERLPMPVAIEDELFELQRIAAANRLDLDAARREVASLEQALVVARGFRYLGESEIAIEYERETDRSRLIGPSLALELPLFNQGEGKLLRAESQLESSQARLRELEIGVNNAVALACARVKTARVQAERYRTELIPQRERIVARTQELLNYLIAGHFELFRAREQEFAAYAGYLEALRDYWIARAELGAQIGAALPSDVRVGAATVDVNALGIPAQGQPVAPMPGMDHDAHSGMKVPAATPRQLHSH